jgi:hypothetical protein
MAFASIPADDLAWTQGEQKVRWFASSSFGRRAFCADCGSPLLVKVDHQPDTMDFPILTLDVPNEVEPAFHIFWSSKVSWFNPNDNLPRYDKFRPNTRGLEGTEPPDNSSLSGGS